MQQLTPSTCRDFHCQTRFRSNCPWIFRMSPMFLCRHFSVKALKKLADGLPGAAHDNALPSPLAECCTLILNKLDTAHLKTARLACKLPRQAISTHLASHRKSDGRMGFKNQRLQGLLARQSILVPDRHNGLQAAQPAQRLHRLEACRAIWIGSSWFGTSDG